MIRRHPRFAIVVALLFAASPWLLGKPDEPGKGLKYFKGKVVPLAGLFAKEGAKLDADAEPHWLALVGDDGKIIPLVKDAGSRMFFKDAKLLNRPMRLTAKLLPGTQFLQTVNVHSLVGGKLHDVYYWCDICTIRAYEAGPCGCCNAPLDFRETPVQ